MITPEELIVKNWATWKYAKVDLTVPGTTYLRGYDADVGGNPNGAGKSTLVNAIYAVSYQDHQLAVRKKAIKSLLSEETYLRYQFSNNDDRFLLEQTGAKLTIDKNGKALDVRKKDSATLKAQRAIGMTPELWSTTVHINGLITNPMIQGKGGERSSFLERAFELDRWKHKYTHVGEQLIGDKRITADIVKKEERLATLPALVDYSDLQEQVDALKTKVGDASKRKDALDRFITTMQSLPTKPPRSSKAYNKLLAKYTNQLEIVHTQAKAIATYQAKRESYKEYVETITKIQETIDTLPDHLKGKAKVAEIDTDIENLSTYLEAWTDWIERKPAIIRFRRIAKEVASSNHIDVTSTEDLKTYSKTWISVLKPDAKNCPVCGNKLANHISKKTLLELADALNDLPNNTKQITEKPGWTAKLRDALVSDRKIITKVEAAKKELASIRKIDKPIRPEGYNEELTAVDLSELISKSRVLALRAKQHEECEFDTDDVDIDDLIRKRDNLSKFIEASLEKIERFNNLIFGAKEAQSVGQELIDQITELRKELKMGPIYKALHSAYSPNGMRLYRLAEIMESLISNLNQGALLTKDRTTYSYKLTKTRELSLLASNIRGTFDVRYLGGAQSRIFGLNLLLTILPLLPERRRCSMLIMDEVDANCSAQTRAILTNEFFPRLAEIVPSVWVVTPASKQEMWTSGARELVAYKKNGVSTLKGT